MNKYIPTEVETKWQKKWQETGLYHVDLNSSKKKFYLLVEFTYPSGDLHMGHWFAFAVPDILARMKRMQGYAVFAPNGFDAFGLPAENAAISRKIHPRDWTSRNIKRMKEQFATMGATYDWAHEVITCDPEYYRWNQWIFLKMLERGLAYREKALANWCPKDQCVLANENVENGKCWRCQTEVVQKEVEQWFLKITDYAQKLLWSEKLEVRSGKLDNEVGSGKNSNISLQSEANLGSHISPRTSKVDWPEALKQGQNNWIGKSEGIEIKFQIPNSKLQIEVFTTRPDTLYGATFLVLAPEHPLVTKIVTKNYSKDVASYQKASAKKSELERKEMKEKTGVFTGALATNPVNGQDVPIWIADYVLMGYGTGAIMAVPAHDQRDFEFAKKYDLRILPVILSEVNDLDSSSLTQNDKIEEAYTGFGKIINSGEWNGWKTPDAIAKIIEWLERKGLGERKVQYHLRDWSISRQRYWGAPIPIVYCDKCGTVPVPLDQLPVELPYKVDYAPKGKPPLATAKDWVKVRCPNCGGKARREVETMDTFVDSSWYFLRYLRKIKNEEPAWDPQLAKAWMPVDIYFGGAEHTLGHTLYSRFFVKFLQDLGVVPPMPEYAQKRVHHGVILGPDGQRMSKSHGNVVNPDEEVKQYGADAVRMYLAFLGPYDLVAPWNPGGIGGVYNFLLRTWKLFDAVDAGAKVTAQDKYEMNKTIKKVSEDVEATKFNTAVSALMQWLNHLSKKAHNSKVSKEEYETLLLLLAPFAPHIAEELWSKITADRLRINTDDQRKSIHNQPWPKYDPKLVQAREITLVVQVNGKVRDRLLVEAGIAQKDAEQLAMNSPRVQKFLSGRRPQKVIFVPGRLINLVV